MIRPTFLAGCLLLAVTALGSPNDEAAALIAKGQFLAAERIVQPLAEMKKPSALSLYQFSQVRLGQHQCEEAIALVKRAIKLDATKAEYFTHLGHVYAAQLEDSPDGFLIDKIRKAMEQALKVDPNHVPALVGLARCYATPAPGVPASYKKAKEYALRAAALDTFQGELELGRLDISVKEPQSALAHYQKALQAKPDDPIVHYSIGIALMQLERRAEAKAELQTAVKLSATPFKDAQEALKTIDEASATKPGK